MRYYQLFEYNSTQTLTNYREPLESRLESDSRAKSVLGGEPTPEAVLRHLEAIDPSKKKAFVLNLLKWYISGSMRFIEDAYKAKEVFPLYTKFKNRDDVPHISTLSFSEFLDLGDRLGETKSGAEIDKEEELSFYKSGEAELLKDTDEVKIIIPKTKEAAIYFGRNTKWCTSAVNDNAFDEYESPLYIFLFKKENKRWQFEFDSGQFMDERDDDLSEEDIYKGFELLGMSEKEIVKYYGIFIRHINNPSEELKRLAVQQNGRAIRHIKNPSEEIKKLAVQQTGFVIQFIKNPSEELKKLAVQENGFSIQYLKDPSEEIQLLTVNNNPRHIYYIENPSEKVQLLAIKKDHSFIKSIKNPTENAQIAAVKAWGRNIYHIKNPSNKVQKIAVQQNNDALRCIKNPSEEAQKIAVQENGLNIVYIENPSEEVQKIAVKQNHNAIEYIGFPSIEIQELAKKIKNSQ